MDDEFKELGNKIRQVTLKFAKKLIIISLPIICVFLILVGIVYTIFNEDGTWKENETGNPRSYTGNAMASTTEGISLDKDKIVEQALKDEGYSDQEISDLTEEEIIELFDMEDELDRNINSLEECTEAEILWCISDTYKRYLEEPEQLEFLLKAELVTQFPKMDNLSTDKLNGIIEFKRVSVDENTQTEKNVMLIYILPEQFEAKYNAYENSGNKDVFNYFTLDEEGNAVIATWKKEVGNFESNNSASGSGQKINVGHTEQTIKYTYDERYSVVNNTGNLITASYTSYTISKTKINYKTMIQQYTLPFEYLWSLLVAGRSYDFVEGLAQLAYNSEITIGIYDTITTSVTVDRKEYTENFRERYEKYESEASNVLGTLVTNTDWTEKNISYYDENEVTVTFNSPVIDLTYANTWIAEVTAQYQRTSSTGEPYENENVIPDEEWSDNGSSTSISTRNITVPAPENSQFIAGELVPGTKTITIYITEKNYREKRITDQMNKSTLNTEYELYEKVQTISKEKTDTEEATDNNFVKLLLADENAYKLLVNKGNLEWLKGILEKNKSTANMVDLTLYLLNKATNSTDYLDSQFTFDDLWEDYVLSHTTINLMGRDFIVNTDMAEPELVIADRGTLIKIINAKYSGKAKENLLAEVDTFLTMQNTYNVNAIFAIAVTQIESSCGTDWAAIDESTHNWMSVTGSYNGNTYKNPNSTNERTWRVYPSFSEATMDFGNLMKNGSYYFKANKNTVREIAPTYCSASWGESIINAMTQLYVEAGINVSIGNGSFGTESGEFYSSTYSIGGRTYRNYKQPKNSDWCGITSAAIVLSGYGYSDTPSMVYNGSVPGYTWRTYMGSKLGIGTLQYQTTNITEGVIKQLNQGKPVIVHVPKNNPGKYKTDEGHFFVILSLEGTTCVVSDPGVADNDAKGRNGENDIYEVLEYVDQFVVM